MIAKGNRIKLRPTASLERQGTNGPLVPNDPAVACHSPVDQRQLSSQKKVGCHNKPTQKLTRRKAAQAVARYCTSKPRTQIIAVLKRHPRFAKSWWRESVARTRKTVICAGRALADCTEDEIGGHHASLARSQDLGSPETQVRPQLHSFREQTINSLLPWILQPNQSAADGPGGKRAKLALWGFPLIGNIFRIFKFVGSRHDLSPPL
jgi:hypothetical protein